MKVYIVERREWETADEDLVVMPDVYTTHEAAIAAVEADLKEFTVRFRAYWDEVHHEEHEKFPDFSIRWDGGKWEAQAVREETQGGYGSCRWWISRRNLVDGNG